MSIEIGSKWVKDGEVVEVLNCRKNHGGIYQDMIPCVWFIFDVDTHILTERDFLEQYKPYEPVYEYRYCYISYFGEICISNGFFKNDDEMKTIIALKENSKDFQRLDFTKRERKQ